MKLRVLQENSAAVLKLRKTDRIEMTRRTHPSSQFEQFTIDKDAQITITRIDVF